MLKHFSLTVILVFEWPAIVAVTSLFLLWVESCPANFIFLGPNPGVGGDGQGGLACCDSWGRKESDMTED